MRICQVSTYDDAGGAAIAAARLHRGLLGHGCDSIMYVARSERHDPAIHRYERPQRNLLERAALKIRSYSEARIGRLGKHIRYAPPWANLDYYNSMRPSGFEMFSSTRVPDGTGVMRRMPVCDVINLHWINDFIDPALFLDRTAGKPVVWTLHDMNPFTGGCHHADDCEKYMIRCGACPQLGLNARHDLSTYGFERKSLAFSRRTAKDLRIVAPSRWMARRAGRSALIARFPIEVIPNGVDLDSFAPREKTWARNVLGIPVQAKVILFIAALLSNERKGFRLLLDALKALDVADNMHLLSVGTMSESIVSPLRLHHLGNIKNERLLSLVYSAADLFVIPSVVENLPNTVLEAMACGTPVVGFDVGGIPEMVHPGITGELAPAGDTLALRAAIQSILDSTAKRKEMSENCRSMIVKEYSADLCVDRYVQLYSEICHD